MKAKHDHFHCGDLLRRYLVAIALAAFSLIAQGQALPKNTPPLFNPQPAPGGMTYGRLGPAANDDVGRDISKPTQTPANDASYNKRTRATATATAAAGAGAKMMRSLVGPIIAGMAMYEFAQDMGAIWKDDPLVGPKLGIEISTYSNCTPPKAMEECHNPGWFQPEDFMCFKHPSGQLVWGFNGGGTNITACASATGVETKTFEQLSETQIREGLMNNSRLGKIALEMDAMADKAGLPLSDPRRVPWGNPRTITPEDIVLPPKVETLPDGTVKTTKTTLVPTVRDDGAVEWTRVESKSEKAPGSETETPQGTVTSADPTPEVDPCEARPNSVGCMEVDTPESEIPKQERQVTYEPEDLGLGAGTCPADMVMDAQKNWKWSYAEICDVLSTKVKPVVLLIAAISAMFIIMGITTQVHD